MQIQRIQGYRQAPGGQPAETLTISLIKINTTLKKPWKVIKKTSLIEVPGEKNLKFPRVVKELKGLNYEHKGLNYITLC